MLNLINKSMFLHCSDLQAQNKFIASMLLLSCTHDMSCRHFLIRPCALQILGAIQPNLIQAINAYLHLVVVNAASAGDPF